MRISVLIVDDDALLRETAQDVLEEAGYEVSSAGAGMAALEQLRLKPRSVVILDFNLPDLRGAELISRVRETSPASKILLMTGEEHPDLGVAQAHVQAILTKPVSPPELVNVIKQIVD